MANQDIPLKASYPLSPKAAYSVGLILFFLFALGQPRAGLWKQLTGANLSRPGSFSAEPREPLFKRAAPGDPDTLQIYVIYAEFASEEPDDNPSTTGLGKFNTGEDENSGLDPVGFRDYTFYLEKHLEFARDYFSKTSGGRLHLTWEFFPRPESTGQIKNPIGLKNRMAAYNPTKKAEEKNVVFFERKANALMTFVAETIRKADRTSGDSDNPFKAAPPVGENVYRSYLIFHAGHSGLVDGGKLGQLGADTPNDIIDFFVTKEDFGLLIDVPEDNQGDQTLAQREDTLGVSVNGGDQVITEMMVLSEAASQDDVNFGINGLLVNQIARQIGMPDTWDRGTGFTQLGYFDLMDVGHLSLFGFVPVFPSAWLRLYMGWDTAVRATPGAGGTSTYLLRSPMASPADYPGSLGMVQIPLNEREYLLAENRQRALDDSVTVYFSYPSGTNSPEFDQSDSVRIALDFIDTLFLDSLCNDEGKDCKENLKRPKGIITSVSSYDMGLPASGIAVWHVNEWFVEQTVRYGYVNASDEQTQEFLGINMVEADGDLSIGKEGKDALGQSVFDFGTGSDLLPHIRKHAEKTEPDTLWEIDTVKYISPNGFSNTRSWNDGRTHIALEALIPEVSENSLLPGINFITGDSVFTYSSDTLALRILWNENEAIQKVPESNWPLNTLKATHPQSTTFLKRGNFSAVVTVSDAGHIEVWDKTGAPLLPLVDTLTLANAYDSLKTLIPAGRNRDSLSYLLHSLGSPIGPILGSAVLADTLLCYLGQSGNLVLASVNWDSLASPGSQMYFRQIIAADGIAGPVIAEGQVWLITEGHQLQAYNSQGERVISTDLPDAPYHSLAFSLDKDGNPFLALTGAGGFILKVDLNTQEVSELYGIWADGQQKFSVLAADFNRDDNDDYLVMGSRGSILIVDFQGDAFPNFPLEDPPARATQFVDSLGQVDYVTQDLAPPAISDINRDGYPDIIFTAANSVAALDYKGAVLWTFQLEERQNVGLLYSSEKFPATVVQSTPLVMTLGQDDSPIILIASPDGLIWALDAQGSPLTSGSYTSGSSLTGGSGVASSDRRDWPLSSGGMNFDTTDVPYINISLSPALPGEEGLHLVSQTGTGGLDLWHLKQAHTTAEANWKMPGGGLGRQNRFAATDLSRPANLAAKNEIVEFHLYPSPVPSSQNFATLHLNVGAATSKSRLRFFDLGGSVVLETNFGASAVPGKQPDRRIQLGNLGPDVYTMLMEVWFSDGTHKKKWQRIGVIR